MKSYTFTILGKTYQPMSEQERARQLADIELRTRQREALATPRNNRETMEELARCGKSFEYFCDNYLTTFDPRVQRKTMPFILYEFQRPIAAVIEGCIRTGNDVVWAKTRDMGASWLRAAIYLWFVLFDPGFQIHLGSRVEDEVDDYTVDSLFGKLDFMVENLPGWMRKIMPYDEKSGRRRLLFRTHEGSMITGESANPSFGRGPRKNVCDFDEYAFTEFDTSIWASMSQTAPCHIIVSTPRGEHNMFHRLWETGEVTRIVAHWTEHPHKTIEWYEKECKKLGSDVLIGQELNVDFRASGGRLALPQMTSNPRIVTPARELDPSRFEFYGGLDYGSVNPTSFHVYAVAKEKEWGRKLPRVYSVWEYYKPSTMQEVATAMLSCPYYPLLRSTYSDPSMHFNNQMTDDGKAVTSFAVLFSSMFKIYLYPGKRGDSFVLRQLEMAWEDPSDPLFQIFDTCPMQIEELSKLHYVTLTERSAQTHNTPEKLVDKDNHSFDDLKYFFNQVFNAPTTQAVVKPKVGWEALSDEVHQYKEHYLKKLTKAQKKPRRMFV